MNSGFLQTAASARTGTWIFGILFAIVSCIGCLAYRPFDPSLPEIYQIMAAPAEAFLLFGIVMLFVSAFVPRPGPWTCVVAMLVGIGFAPTKAEYAFVHRTLIAAHLYPDPIIHAQFVNPNFGKIVVFMVAFIAACAASLRRPTLERSFLLVGGFAMFLTTGLFHAAVAYPTTVVRQQDALRLMEHVVRDAETDAGFMRSCAAFGYQCYVTPYADVKAAIEAVDSYYVTPFLPLIESLPRNPRVVSTNAIVDSRTGVMNPSAAAAYPAGAERVRMAFDHQRMKIILAQGEWSFNALATAAYAVWGPGIAALMLWHIRRKSFVKIRDEFSLDM